MDPLLVLTVLGALVLSATALGLVWQSRQGRVSRLGRAQRPADLPLALIDTKSAFTLLQFSGPYCSYCAAMRKILGEAATRHSDTIAHREIDITDYPDVVTALRISQTPTTLVVDSAGHIHSRIHGAAKPATVEQEIQQALDARKAATDEYLI